MEVSSISFGAKSIGKTINIKKYDKMSKKFLNYPVYFVKLEKDNKQDLEVTTVAAQKWQNAKHIQNIATSAHWMTFKPIDVYALTSQKDNFETLRYEKILGFAAMRKDEKKLKNTKLYYLQVRPSAMNVNQENKVNYKHVGSAILTKLKKLYKNITLDADNDKNVIAFYKSNGFIEDYYKKNHFAWSSNIFNRMLIRYRAFRIRNGI